MTVIRNEMMRGELNFGLFNLPSLTVGSHANHRQDLVLTRVIVDGALRKSRLFQLVQDICPCHCFGINIRWHQGMVSAYFSILD